MLVMSSESAPAITTTKENDENKTKKTSSATTIPPHDEEAGVVTHDEDSNMGFGDKPQQQQQTDTIQSTDVDDDNKIIDSINNNSDDVPNNIQEEERPDDNIEPTSSCPTTTNDTTEQQPPQQQVEEVASSSTTAAGAADNAPPPPLLKGTLTYNLESRRHMLRGNWNYDYSKTPSSLLPAHKIPAQRFELIRNFPPNTPEEEIKLIPVNGEFHGSFSLAYHITKNGKTRERSKVVPESGVHIQFEPILEEGVVQQQQLDLAAVSEFKVTGRGTNQFGEFDIYGNAVRSGFEGEQDTFHVELRKRYVAVSIPPVAASAESKKRSSTTDDNDDEELKSHKKSRELEPPPPEEALPPPSPSFPVGVVCLRGKLFRDRGEQAVGVQENLHRIRGFWSTGLDILLSDPNNEKGLCNPFDYEHKSIDEKNESFPLSGRYTGFFLITNEDGTRTRIAERDVFLKFKHNSNAGGYNVEGKGSNIFGKYTISGAMEPTTSEKGTVYLITIFRHFQPRKVKKEKKLIEEAPPVLLSTTTTRDSPLNNKKVKVDTAPELPIVLSLDQIVVPGLADFVPTEDNPTFVADAIVPPEHGSYSAVSRGVLRINGDGAHTCGGKWAISREHFANNMTSNFHFGLEAHHALEEAKKVLAVQGRLPDGADTALPSDLPVVFPLDSAQYKGSFRIKRGANKFSSVIDKQIVLKFVRNSGGSFNVYGKGCNNIGQFDLIGTLIQQGQSSGQVELYRMYYSAAPSTEDAGTATSSNHVFESTKKEAHAPQQVVDFSTQSAAKTVSPSRKPDLISEVPLVAPVQGLSSLNSTTPMPGLLRTESGRSVKLPSRLEDSDPEARKARIMEKCSNILRFLRDQDAATGSFFAEPVDPVALGIPTYNQIISNPMDLGTIQLRMTAGQLEDHEEFAHLIRLVFENAMRFNVDPSHPVYVRARDLLVLFNRKFSDVERIASSSNEKRRLSKSELKTKQREEKRKEREASKEAKRKAKEEKSERIQRQKTEVDATQPATFGLFPSVEVSSTSEAAPEGYVAKSEFDRLHQQMHQMQVVIAAMQQQLAAVGAPVMVLPNMNPPSVQPASASSMSTSRDKQLSGKSKMKGKSSQKKLIHDVDEDEEDDLDNKPLSLKEQEQLSDAINRLTGKRLDEAIRIIRESTQLSDEGEIDLEIDQLDNPTQRKLQRFVLKTKLNRTKKLPKTAAPKKLPTPIARAPTPSSAVPERSSNADSFAKSKPTAAEKQRGHKKGNKSSFLGFGGDAASGDDSDDGDSGSSSSSDSEGALTDRKNAGGKGGKTADSFILPDHSMDMDDHLNDDAIANKDWNLTVGAAALAGNDEEDSDDDKDTLWGAARMEAEANKQREAERRAREDKVRAQAELESKERLASAQATADMIRAKRLEEEEEEAKLNEEKAREAEEKRMEAREAVRRNVLETKQTVDLDAQRSLMEMYERSIIDTEIGDSASPSYNFGF